MPVWAWLFVAIGFAVFAGILALFFWPTGPSLPPIVSDASRSSQGLASNIIANF